MTNRCRLQFRATRVRPGIACTFAAALLVAHHSGVEAQHAGGASSPALVVFAEQSGAGADRAPLSAQASATLETIQSDPAASDIRIGHGNPDAVIAARALSLALPSSTDACTDSGEGALDFTDVEVTYNDEDMVSLYARDEAKDAEVSLVIQGPDVLGSIRCGDEVYKLTPLGGGMTAVYEFDTSKLRQHPPGWREFILDSWTEILQEGEQDEGGQAPVPEAPDPGGTPGAAADTGDVIDILVAYTPAAKVGAGNIDNFIQMAINNTNRIVEITAIDDNGTSFGPVTLSLAAGAAAHFNSQDLESVNPDKDLSGRLGNGTGDWRLALETDLEIEHLAYIRTADGFVTNMHEVAAETEAGSNRYHVPIFNPGKNRNQESKLRVINPGSSSATVDITGVDDDGRAPRLGTVQLTLRAGSARTLTAYELENGSSKFSGRLGAGTGKWRLSVSADRPVMVMSLVELPQGHLTNLSRGQPGVSVPPPLLNEPDLVVESPSANPTTPSAGQLVLLSATVRNQGGAQAPATRLRFYRSSDATITRTDSALQTASVRALPPPILSTAASA